jgi:hypothetical protein
MRKRLITPTPETVRSRHEGWLEIERLAIVEITSEEKIIQSRLHSFREKRRAGAPPSRARKRSGSCLISCKR